MVSNKHCPVKNLEELKNYSLSEISKMLELIEIREAIDMANSLDEREQADSMNKR